MNTMTSPPPAGPDATEMERFRITKRTEQSALMRAVHVFLRLLRPALARPSMVHPKGSPQLTPPKSVRKRCDVHERKVDDVWIYDLTRKPLAQSASDGKERPQGGARTRIYYFAGGGWQTPASNNHWAFIAELARRVPDTTITLVSYPLAPESPASLTLPVLRKLYDTLMAESAASNERVIFAGDSSGGNLALAIVLWAVQTPEALAPVAVLGICPTTDLRHEAPGLKERGKKDPLLTVKFINRTARAWCDALPMHSEASQDHEPIKWDAADPRISPGLADLNEVVGRGVKIHGVTGTYDVLSVEAEIFRDRCKREGVTGEWLDWHGQMHVFPLVFSYGLKEGKEAVDWIVDVLVRT